nr:sugar phosphate isomerase/epimerase family protein [Fervidobacterium pennivorans]
MKLAYMWVDPSIPEKSKVTGLRGSIKDTIGVLSKFNFNAVEIMLGDPFFFESTGLLEGFRKNCDLCISQLCTGEFFGTYGLTLNNPDPQMREKALSWMFKTVEIAGTLGCSVNIGRFRGFISSSDPIGSKERMFESFQRIDEIANLCNIKILLEPLKSSVCNVLNSISECVKVIQKLNLKHFDIMLDTDHTNFIEERQFLEQISLTYVHLADKDHLPLGNGSIDFAEYFLVLRELNFDGYLSVETFCSHFQCVENAVRFLHKYIVLAEDGVWVWKKR